MFYRSLIELLCPLIFIINDVHFLLLFLSQHPFSFQPLLLQLPILSLPLPYNLALVFLDQHLLSQQHTTVFAGCQLAHVLGAVPLLVQFQVHYVVEGHLAVQALLPGVVHFAKEFVSFEVLVAYLRLALLEQGALYNVVVAPEFVSSQIGKGSDFAASREEPTPYEERG